MKCVDFGAVLSFRARAAVGLQVELGAAEAAEAAPDLAPGHFGLIFCAKSL